MSVADKERIAKLEAELKELRQKYSFLARLYEALRPRKEHDR